MIEKGDKVRFAETAPESMPGKRDRTECRKAIERGDVGVALRRIEFDGHPPKIVIEMPSPKPGGKPVMWDAFESDLVRVDA